MTPQGQHFDVVLGLKSSCVRQQFVLRHQQLIAGTQFGLLLAGIETRADAHLDDGILRRALRLTVEEVGDGGDSIELELLIGVELEFHFVLSAVISTHIIFLVGHQMRGVPGQMIGVANEMSGVPCRMRGVPEDTQVRHRCG